MRRAEIFGIRLSVKFLDRLPQWCRKLGEALSTVPNVVDTEQMRSTLQYLVLSRVIILSLLLGAGVWSYLDDEVKTAELYIVFWPIGVTYAASVINSIWLRYTRYIRAFGYGQLLLDVLLASLAIYVTQSMGGLVLYLLAILGAAFVFNGHGAVITAAACGLCYALVASGILPPLGETEMSVSTLDILGVYISLICIALASALFSNRFARISNIATRQEKDLSELSRQQRQLFDDISEGIVTIDLNSVITSINQAAQAIMGLTEINPKTLLGVSLPQVWQQYGLESNPELDVSSAGTGSQEIALSRSGADEELCLSYTVRPITNSEGIETGRMVLFSDVSRVRDIEMQLSLHERMTELLERSSATLPTLDGSFSDQVQIIGDSGIMQQVFSLIGKVANSDASVLISGESGTGKELVARAIHARGNRKNSPFIAVNCGAIPENLIESELFGHKKGAFTGAVSDSLGLFRQASKGTLFLDEIGELPLHLQSKLLRVIQDRRIRAVGDVHDHVVDVRLITATNRELRKEIRSGSFREDLFYRLNVVNIVAPPLRDRTEDIPVLVRYFVGKHSDVDQVLPRISPEALACLINYPFPGNVRELENVIERALVLGGHAILPEHLPTEIREYRPSSNKTNGHSGSMPETEIRFLPVNLEEHLADIERQYLLKALEESGGVKKQAASLLGLNFRSFRYRLKKYCLGENNSLSDEN